MIYYNRAFANITQSKNENFSPLCKINIYLFVLYQDKRIVIHCPY